MNAAQFDIGQQVSIERRGERVQGRIVGREFIEDRRRGNGWTYLADVDGSWIAVPQDAVTLATSEK